MPSQFPENNVTGTLTAEKVATTNTSATSLDVGGGITAGTSSIAIVNAAGKIPALSSTYLADLSGANLTGISAGGFPFISKASLTSGKFESGTLSLAGSGVLVVWQNVECDTDAEIMIFEVNNVTSSSYNSFAKLWRSDGNVGHTYGGTLTYGMVSSDVNPQGRLGNAAGEQQSGHMFMTCDGTYVQWYGSMTCMDPSTLPTVCSFGGIITQSSITDIMFKSTGGNLDAGEVMFYNIAES